MSTKLPEEDHLIRMQRDLKRTQTKKPEAIKWTMVIDVAKCIGCHACTLGCVAENKLPPGVVYRPVIEEEIGTYPNVRRRFLPRPCMQCQNPPCVKVCPVTATYKNHQGVTVINYDGVSAVAIAWWPARTRHALRILGSGTRRQRRRCPTRSWAARLPLRATKPIPRRNTAKNGRNAGMDRRSATPANAISACTGWLWDVAQLRDHLHRQGHLLWRPQRFPGLDL